MVATVVSLTRDTPTSVGEIVETYTGNHYAHIIAASTEKHKTLSSWSFADGFLAHSRPRYTLGQEFVSW